MALIDFNALSRGNSLFGLNGFLNGNQLGKNEDNKSHGLLDRLGMSPGRNQLALPSATSALLQRPEKSKLENSSPRDEDKKKDQVNLSEFAQEAAEKAVENAKKSPKVGETNQIIVSEDGRFEASVDLRYKADGSFDLDLAVKFAQSSSIALGSIQQQALPEGEQTLNEKNTPAQFAYQGLAASSQQTTSYEQYLETRGFQAEIFYEESKSIALQAEQVHDEQTGADMLSVSRQVAHEFTLNISISGDDLNAFNEAAESLVQFDDTGTLKGFLDAARGVLNSDSSNLGSFVEATNGLLDAAKEHVNSKLGSFFSSIQDQFGSTLEEMGYAPDFLEKMGEDTQKDLNTFFQATQDFFRNIAGITAPENANDIDQQKVDLLEQNMEQIREQQEEALKKEQEQVETSPERGKSELNPVSEERSRPSDTQKEDRKEDQVSPSEENRNNPSSRTDPENELSLV